jgi:hypothetical protein
MKKLIFAVVLVTLVGATWVQEAGATDFFDVLKYSVSGGAVKNVNAQLYNATVTGAFNDSNLNGTLDANETMIGTVKLYDRSGKLILQSPQGLNRTQLESWALANSKVILNTIFEGSFSQVTGQSDDGVMSQTKFSEKILQKVMPTSSEFKGSLEYQRLEVNKDTGNSYSGVLDCDLGYGSGLDIGLMMPYRYTQLNDEAKSKSNFLGLDLYAKYPVKKWDKVTLNLGADVFGSAFVLQSDAISILGNLKYGGSAFTSLGVDMGFGMLSLGCDYMISGANIPSGLVDTQNQWIQDAINYVNDLKTVQTVTYGGNLGIPFAAKKAAVNLEVTRSNFISSDIPSDRSAETLCMLSVAYRPLETFELSLGVNKTYELEGVDVWGITFGTIFRF